MVYGHVCTEEYTINMAPYRAKYGNARATEGIQKCGGYSKHEPRHNTKGLHMQICKLKA